MTTAKICGLSTAETVGAALDGGASHIGFMFFAKSPRNINAHQAARLAAPARAARVKIVSVLVDPDDETLDGVTAALRPDLIQLHGRETAARVKQVRERTGLGVIKVTSVSDAHDIDAALRYEGVADHLMLDAKATAGDDRPGGLGKPFDWSLLIGRRFARPWFLAGGLDPWTVTEAIRLTGAPIVDVSSGVERGAGLKDAALIEAFLEAVRRA